MAIQNPNNRQNYHVDKTIMMKYNFVKELVKGTHDDTQHKNNVHPKPVL